jgi:fructose-specific phosphotransferase system IIC component
MIGRFIGREGMGANNGYVSHGFAHAGYFGVIIYSIILGLLLKLIDDMTYNKLPLWFSISLSIAPLRTVLINSDLFTTMLTHGLFISLIIIFLSRSNYDYS